MSNFERREFLPNQPKIGNLGSGQEVINRFNSHIHFTEEFTTEILKEALLRVKTNEQFLAVEVDMERIVGKTVVVKTNNNEDTFYAQRLGRYGYSRFVVGKEPNPCQHVTVVIKKSNEKQYVLLTAYIGRKVVVEPYDGSLIGNEEERQKSLSFWRSHAFVADSEPIIEGSQTIECPWK